MHKWSGARVALVGLGPIGIEVGKALVGRPGHRAPGRGRSRRPPSRASRSRRSSERRRRRRSRSTASPPRSTRAPRRHAAEARRRRSSARARAWRTSCSQIEEAVDAGFHVVSTCEELSYPGAEARGARPPHRPEGRQPHGVAVLGTGRQPRPRHGPAGAGRRGGLRARGPRQGHARRGRGQAPRAAPREGRRRALTREEFAAGVAANKLGHVGLSESAAIIALGLGLPIHEITETIEPVLAEKETDGIAAGRVLGLHQIALVQAGDEVKVALDLTMAVGVADPADTIEIDGRSAGEPAGLGRLPRRPRDGRMRRQRDPVHRRGHARPAHGRDAAALRALPRQRRLRPGARRESGRVDRPNLDSAFSRPSSSAARRVSSSRPSMPSRPAGAVAARDPVARARRPRRSPATARSGRRRRPSRSTGAGIPIGPEPRGRSLTARQIVAARRGAAAPSGGPRPRLGAGLARERGRRLPPLHRRLQAPARAHRGAGGSSARATLLVTETTFGLPVFRFPRQGDARRAPRRRLPRRRSTDGETPVLLAYALGKAQETAAILAAAGIPTVLHGAAWKLLPEYEAAGHRLPLSRAYETGPPLRGRGPRRAARLRAHAGRPEAQASGASSTSPAGRSARPRAPRLDADVLLPFSDHADFPDLLAARGGGRRRERVVTHARLRRATSRGSSRRAGIDGRGAAPESAERAPRGLTSRDGLPLARGGARRASRPRGASSRRSRASPRRSRASRARSCVVGARLLAGSPFAEWEETVTSAGWATVTRAAAAVTGWDLETIGACARAIGDLGEAVGLLLPGEPSGSAARNRGRRTRLFRRLAGAAQGRGEAGAPRGAPPPRLARSRRSTC